MRESPKPSTSAEIVSPTLSVPFKAVILMVFLLMLSSEGSVRQRFGDRVAVGKSTGSGAVVEIDSVARVGVFESAVIDEITAEDDRTESACPVGQFGIASLINR